VTGGLAASSDRPAEAPTRRGGFVPPAQEVTAEFLVGDSGGLEPRKGTAWKVHFARGMHKGLYITGAWYKRNLSEDWIKILSYGFHDDGTISFRVGATGQNLPGHRKEAHTHNAHWRIDIDLIDGKKNSAMVMRHVEDPASAAAEDIEEPFNRGFEGGIDWDPKEFTMVRLETDRKNANGKTIGYDLMPMRMGSARHNEDFTGHDYWVTRSHPERPLEYIFSNLPNMVKDEETVESADIVLWATSSSHHEPRDEDGKPDSAPKFWPGDDAWEGSALVMWSGFDPRPRNFFDRTPFYQRRKRELKSGIGGQSPLLVRL